MTTKTKIILDHYPMPDVVAEVEGRVSKHWGQLEVSDFYSDVKLTPTEIDMAHEALIEKARSELACFPEQEAEARGYSR